MIATEHLKVADEAGSGPAPGPPPYFPESRIRFPSGDSRRIRNILRFNGLRTGRPQVRRQKLTEASLVRGD